MQAGFFTLAGWVNSKHLHPESERAEAVSTLVACRESIHRKDLEITWRFGRITWPL